MTRLYAELESGSLSVFSYNVIISLTHKVVYKLTMKHDNVQEKVGDVMGGRVLDLPEIRIFHEGKAVGYAEGETRGEAKGEAARKKLAEENVSLNAEIVSLKRELELLKSKLSK